MKFAKRLILVSAAASLYAFAPMSALAGSWADANAAYKSKDYVTLKNVLNDLGNGGDHKAMLTLALLYTNGTMIEKSDTQALLLYKKIAASKNSLPAKDNNFVLGVICHSYYTGKGVAQSYPAAFQRCTKAAQVENDVGMTYLGIMYASGQGTQKSKDTAIYWLKKSRDAGGENSPNAIKMLKKLGVQ